MMKRILIGIFLSGLSWQLLSACASSERGHRSSPPAKNIADLRGRSPQGKTEEEKSAFRRGLLPLELRNQKFSPQKSLAEAPEKCRSSDYGPWMKPLVDKDQRRRREDFLVEKLNRPFFFVFDVKERGMGIGRTEDFLEFMCIVMALDEGEMQSDPAAVKFDSDFVPRVLRHPHINEPVFTMILSLWMRDPQDSAVPALFLNHPKGNFWTAQEFTGDLFNAPIPLETRLMGLRALFASRIYQAHRKELAAEILDQLNSHRLPNEEHQAVLRMLAKDHKEDFAANQLMDLAMKNLDPSNDLSPLYRTLSAGKNSTTRIALLMAALRSPGVFTNADAEYLALWREKLEAPEVDQLFDFAASPGASRRLSADTILRVTRERLDRGPLSDNQLEGLLGFSRNVERLSSAERSGLFQKICPLIEERKALAESLLHSAERLIDEKVVTHQQVGPCVERVGMRFLKDPEILRLFSIFVSKLKDEKQQLRVTKDLLQASTLPDRFLQRIAQTALGHLQDDNAIPVLKGILAQPEVTTATLHEISEAIRLRGLGKARGMLEILSLLDNHPLATPKIRESNRQSRSGELPQLDESTLERLRRK